MTPRRRFLSATVAASGLHERMAPRRWRLPLFLSGLVLLSQAFPLPSPVRDAATLSWASGFHLILPAWHILFTPFCSLADHLSVLSFHQDYVLVFYVIAGCLLTGWRRGALYFMLFVAFIAWGVLVPRPMGKLVSDNPSTLLIDFHSHSLYSHDGRHSFTPQANMRWHRLQGYEASFITDHNRVEAAQIAKGISQMDWQTTNYRSLEGEEVSLQKTHLVILGNHTKVDNRPYDGYYDKIPIFIHDMHKIGCPVIASLPEYWFYHWGAGVQDFLRWGMDGFELINSAPKALDFPVAYRLQIVGLCRSQNLFMTGISDNHGYGYATAAWNAMQVPGWREMDADTLEKAVLKTLATERFQAVQVLERVRFIPGSFWGLLLSPFATLWLYWRSLQPLQSVSWVAWIWIIFALFSALRARDA